MYGIGGLAVGKMVSATEFKAKCLQLIAAMERDGEPITVTRRGKPVAEVTPSGGEANGGPRRSAFGAL